jgi:hypothetical protein
LDAGAPAHEPLRALAVSKLPEVEALVARAEAIRDWLTHARACSCTDLDGCPLFSGPRLDAA